MAAPPPKKMGLSLYADLLEPNKQKAQGATISGAPVKYDVKNEADDEAAKRKDASLKFQPIKRPQVQPKSKPKIPPSSSSTHKFSSSTATASASSPDNHVTSSTPQQPPSVQRSNFEDWVGDEDDEFYYQDNRPRGGSKKKKKKNKGQDTRTWDWDDIYDPTMPNSYADYKNSEEQFREIRDWKARLYYHMRDAKKKSKNGAAYSDEEPISTRPMNSMFAPPSNLSFAPPTFDDSARESRIGEDEDDYYPPPAPSDSRRDSEVYEPPASFAPASTSDDVTGDDIYLRRMRMSGTTPEQPTPPPPPTRTAVPAVPNPPLAASKPDVVDLDAKRAEAQAKIAAFKAKLLQKSAKPDSTPAVTAQATAASPTPPNRISSDPEPPPPPPPPDDPGATISRAPIRYEVPPPPADTSADEDQTGQDGAPEAEQPKSNRPGQKGFAERLLKKYGWEKGQGLGAQGEGITTALIGKADKRKKLSDREGGGWAQPANMGKIIGGKRRKVESSSDPAQQDDARFGKMSEVIKLEGMLDGMDVQKEIEEKNLMQEVGDDLGSNYGNVERVFVWRREMGGKDEVFVKFTSQLSALRAVKGLDGIEFAGNAVAARFWDAEMFEKGEFA